MKDTRQIIDLTHTLSSSIPGFDAGCCYSLKIACDYKDCTAPNLFRTQKIECMGGAGTHMDAPAHAFENAQTIDAVELETLVTDCVVIFNNNAPDENYLVMPEAIDAFEKEYGKIRPKTFVIFHTGWDRYWDTPEKYRNDLKFPSVHEETAKLLLERDIAGIGIDTLSPDARGEDFPVHRVMLGAGKYIVENIAHAKKVPPTGANILIMPMKIEGGTEAPVRLVALVP